MLKRFTGLIAAALLLLAPVVSAAASSGYRIQPGDTLQLEVLEDASLNRTLLVLPDGSVTVPMIGSIKAAGRTVDDLRAAVAQGLAPSFANKPTVYLSVGSVAPPSTTGTTGPTITIYAMGEVGKPGQIEVPSGSTVLQALAMSGGLTNFAATKRIELLRQDSAGHQQVYFYNYKALSTGEAQPAMTLKSGDVIVVPQRRLFE